MKERTMPDELSYFTTDTGDAAHGFSGVIEGEADEERVRRVYGENENVKGMTIGRYVLVTTERVKG
jgi:hypothetical protein